MVDDRTIGQSVPPRRLGRPHPASGSGVDQHPSNTRALSQENRAHERLGSNNFCPGSDAMTTATKKPATKAKAAPAKPKRTKKPAAPPPPLDLVVTLTGDDAADFVKAVRATAIAASNDDARFVLTGMHLVAPNPKTLRLEATDSYRLYRVDFKWPGDPLPPELDVIVPAAFLVRHLPRRVRSLPLTLRFTDRTITIEFANFTYGARLIGADYPLTSKLIDEIPTVTTGLEDGKVRAFNPGFLADIYRAVRVLDDVAAVRISHLDPMKPCKFDVIAPPFAAELILMPVRVA